MRILGPGITQQSDYEGRHYIAFSASQVAILNQLKFCRCGQPFLFRGLRGAASRWVARLRAG
jgi:hypothetical protein